MDDETPRNFADDAAVRHVGEGLIHCRLGREAWTHEAHIAACAYLILERPDRVAERDLPDLIRRFNLSVGGINDDEQGYHETITQGFIRAVRLGLCETGPDGGLVDRVNRLLHSRFARRDWPLDFWSRDRLFSRDARRHWVEPDLRPLPPAPAQPV